MELLWISNLEKEFHHDHEFRPVLVCNDSEACVISINNTEIQHQSQSRHSGVRYHWVRDRVILGGATVSHIPGEQMPVDGLNKSLDRTKHNLFLDYIGLK